MPVFPLIQQCLPKRLLHVCLLLTLACLAARTQALEFNQTLDLQARIDDRSSRQLRYQYRARYYPSVRLSDTLSAHAFVVTGDEFGSSHNTASDGSAAYVSARRAYLRHEGEYGKTEVGVIPTYKGAVSSSGLSKDGWIQGLRHVRNLANSKLELVVGQLDSTDPSQALGAPSEIDYLELEFSAVINEKTSYEVSVERMIGANFTRMELRRDVGQSLVAFGELVARLGESSKKLVLGVESDLPMLGETAELSALYAYVSDDFGSRADLTEDFLGTGHGITAELSYEIGRSNWGWFVRFDGTESRSRFIAGIKWSQ
ncbi:MAG: hypothetical protein NXH85_13995 [Pseudomonadaceae bacterium]|nr:hypothetical protein [Pseudomonadaceae bacterium]